MFRPAYGSTIVTTSEKEGDQLAEYHTEPKIHGGGILLKGPFMSYLLVLFNIEMQHVGRWARKVLYSLPRSPIYGSYALYTNRDPELKTTENFNNYNYKPTRTQ
jgi:hypothetical protein